jgi:signal transduction histidine kinase
VDDRRRTVVDALIATALAGLSIALVLSLTEGPGRRAVHVGLVLAHVLPLAVRRRAPLQVLAAMVATGVASVAVGLPVVVLGPAILVSLYTVAACCPATTSRRATVGATVVMTPVVVANGMDASTVITNAAAFALAWWLGDRSRRANEETDVQRALAAHAASRAAAEERVRIAREMHDVVAHAMSVIAVQAGTGRYVIDDSPDVAKEALASIEQTSRDALQEMRRLLSVLRGEDDNDIGLLPAPSLADIGTLVAASADAGLQVHLDVHGEPLALPAGADLCAFRIVQEALTNVRKHSGAQHAWVTISWSPCAVGVEVVDDGRGPGGSSNGGHGLVGMRERVELYGGTLEVGLRPGGGCVVRASIPVAVPA